MSHPYKVPGVDTEALLRLIRLINDNCSIKEVDYTTAFYPGAVASGVCDLLRYSESEGVAVSNKYMVLAYLSAILENNVNGVSKFSFDIHADFDSFVQVKTATPPEKLKDYTASVLWRFN